MTTTVDDTELKTRHARMWASGNYPRMVETFLLPLGPRLVDACGVTAGTTVLDVATGTGNAALPAAARGAHVTASDLTPELLEAGRRRAGAAGLQLEWRQATARHLPLAHPAHDVVMCPTGGRRRAPGLRRRLVRRGDALDRRHFRPAPPGGRRRAGPRLPPRGDDRHPLLDAGGSDRCAVPDDEAFRAAAPARCAAGAAVGQRGAPAGPVRRARRVLHAAPRGPRDHRLRRSSRIRPARHRLLRPDHRRPCERREGGPRGRARRGTGEVLPGVGPRRRRTGPLRDGVPGRRGHPPLIPTGCPRVAGSASMQGPPAAAALIEDGWRALEQADWDAARSAFAAALADGDPVEARDGLAQTMWFLGDVAEAIALRGQAFDEYARAG